MQRCRRFELIRHEDPTGVSGVGMVAEGVEFVDGLVVLRWNTAHKSTALYDSIRDLLALHGHGGRTTVRWIDQ